MSTSISQRMAREIEEEVSRLLGRGRTAFECPLSIEERAQLWHGMFDPGLLGAFDLLKVNSYDTYFHKTHAIEFQTIVERETYTVSLWNHDASDADGVYRLFKTPGGDDYLALDRVAAAFPKPVDQWPNFVQWIQNTGRIEKDSEEAIATLSDLLGFCNTIGQLTRAVPELAQYLSTEKREILQGQKRASNMPFEWSSFDRNRINVLQFSLAKAHLLPIKNNQPWGDIYNSRARLHPRL